MTITRLLAPSLVLLASACACSTPHAVAQEPTVQITGEFLADGSCRVTVDGTPLFSESEKPRTIYLRGRALNMAPAGFDLHEIWCSPMTAGEPMLPDQPNERAFFINVYAPTGKLAPAQHYLIIHGLPRSSGSATAIRANVSLFGHSSSTTTAAERPLGTTYLAGTAGDVTLTQVDSTHVVGKSRALAVPEQTM